MKLDLPERITRVETSLEHIARTNTEMSLAHRETTAIQRDTMIVLTKIESTLESLSKIEPKLNGFEESMSVQREMIRDQSNRISSLEQQNKVDSKEVGEINKSLGSLERRWMMISGAGAVLFFLWTQFDTAILQSLGILR